MDEGEWHRAVGAAWRVGGQASSAASEGLLATDGRAQRSSKSEKFERVGRRRPASLWREIVEWSVGGELDCDGEVREANAAHLLGGVLGGNLAASKVVR